MKYIGGDFASSDINECLISSDNLKNYFFLDDKDSPIYFQSASDGLAAIIDDITNKQQAVLLCPINYCRETLKVICSKTENKNIKLFFYDEVETLKDLETDSKYLQILIIMHFNSVYATSYEKNFAVLNKKFNIIEDFVQYPFNIEKRRSVYAVNSLRKILPLELAVVYGLKSKRNYVSTMSIYYQIKKKAAKIKSEFLLNPELRDKEKLYLDLFKKAEQNLREPKIFRAQLTEVNLLNKIDFYEVLKKRKANYNFLFNRINKLNQIEVIPGEYMYLMFLTDKQQEVKVKLARLGVFAAIHWADSFTPISKKILSIPIDQRYNFDDMKYIEKCLKKILSVNEKC